MVKMKKVLACVLAAALMVTSAVPVFATNSEQTGPNAPVDQPSVEVGSDSIPDESPYVGEASVSTTKEGDATLKNIEFSADAKGKSVDLPSTVTVNGATYTVTTLSKNAIVKGKCHYAKKVNIPETITKITRNALSNAPKSIKTLLIKNPEVTFGSGALRNFKGTIRIPKGWTSAQKRAFKRACQKAGFKGKFKKAINY